jgi:hypothetical protein
VSDFDNLAGRSQVDSFSIDGSAGSGTATFTDFMAYQFGATGDPLPEPVTGTFEVNCG